MKKLILFLVTIVVLIWVGVSLERNQSPGSTNFNNSPTPQPLTDKEVAIQILTQHPSYTCPNVSTVIQWQQDFKRRFSMNSGASFTVDQQYQLKIDNELFWSCWMARSEEYQAEAKALQYQQQSQPRPQIIPQFTSCNWFGGFMNCSTF